MKNKNICILVGMFFITNMIIGSITISDEIPTKTGQNNEITMKSSDDALDTIEHADNDVSPIDSFIYSTNLDDSRGPFSPEITWLLGGITSNPCGGDATFCATLVKKGLTATSCELFFVWDTESHLLWPFYPHWTSNITYSGLCPHLFCIPGNGFTRGVTYYIRGVAINDLGFAEQTFLELSFMPGEPNVDTNSASELNYTSARLNGNLVDGGFCGTTCDVWFVYDTTSHDTPYEYAFSTQHQTKNSNGIYNQIITGLSIGTIYYYRACASNDVSSDYGSENSFLTWGAYYTWEDADGDGLGTTVDFNASASCGDNSIISYEWDWTNDGTYDYLDTDPYCSHNYTDTYPHDCKLRIVNIYGQTDTIINTVKATVKITATTNGPFYGFVNSSIQFIATVSGGTPPFNWTWDFGDGNVSYEQYPIHTYLHPDMHAVILSVTDNYEGEDQDTTYADIQPVGGNHNPIANNDYSTVEEDSVNNIIDVLANDFDPNWDDIDIVSVGTPLHGSAIFNSAFVYYTPDSNYNGQDQFDYCIQDEHGGNDTATVYISITPVNDNPIANDDYVTVSVNSSNNKIDVLQNDFDIDGDNLQIINVTSPAHGTVSYTPDFTYYTPNTVFIGADSFIYFISDNHTGIGSAIVHIDVNTGEPDLFCEGSLNWVDVTPGATVTGVFTVENNGDPTSNLDWAISEYPGWGTWSFVPSSGENLKPQDPPISIQVEIVAPNQPLEEYSGNIKIINIYNTSDYCLISVSLSTPTKLISTKSQIQILLEKQIKDFPYIMIGNKYMIK